MLDTQRIDADKRKRFRELLARPGIIVQPGAYDTVSARLIEQAGFDTIGHSGYGSSASTIGQSDVGLMCFGEMQWKVYRMAKAVNIPLFADADTGYGNAINVYRTVKEFIWAGASGLFFEDQAWPKRCGHMAGKEVISKEELLGRARAAVRARNEQDPTFTLMLRTDAIAVNGIEDAIERVNLCHEAGIDLGFVEALKSLDDMKKAVAESTAPLMLNMVEVGGLTPLITVKEAEEIGFKIITFPATTWLAAAKAMKDALNQLRETGNVASYRENLMDFYEFGNVMGLDKVWDMEKMYLPEETLSRKYSRGNKQ